MAKPRLFVENELDTHLEIDLQDGAHHYLTRVMRLKEGHEFEVFNGHSSGFQARILTISKRATRVMILGEIRPFLMPPPLVLAFAPVKKTRTDFIVEKACELGVRAIQPVMTAFTNTERVRTDRLERVAIEAVEQCGGTFIPQVNEVMGIEEFLTTNDAQIVFCDEAASSGDGLKNLENTHAENWCIIIGPEGGFSQAERELILRSGALRLSLGPRVLRADTASIAAITLWQSVHGDWRGRGR